MAMSENLPEALHVGGFGLTLLLLYTMTIIGIVAIINSKLIQQLFMLINTSNTHNHEY